MTGAAGGGDAGPVVTSGGTGLEEGPPPESGGPTGAGGGSTGTAPRGFNPPEPGTYIYDTTRDGKKADRETRRIDALGSDGGTTRQTATTGGAQEGVDITIVTELVWSSVGSVAIRTDFRTEAGDARCDWNPDVSEYRGDMATGSQWGSDASCRGQIAGGDLSGESFFVRRELTRNVIGSAREAIGGSTVPTWSIQFHERLEFEFAGSRSVIESSGVEQFAADLGIPVAERRAITTTTSDDRTTTQFTRRIRSVTPS